MPERSPNLLPARLRLPALLVAVLGWAEMLVLGVHFAGQHTPDPFDASVASTAYRYIGQRSVLAHILVSPSDTATVYAVIAIVFLLGVFARSWTVAALALLGPGLAVAITEFLLKPGFGRTFPRGGLSYPSGHTVSSVAALTVALLVGLTLLRARRARLVAGAVYAVLVIMLTIGLVAMRYHYLTDIFGGYGMALGVVLPIAVLLSWWSERAVPPRRGTARPAGTPPAGTSSGTRRAASPR
ncbi:MAG TPA: phosphatase PAP2 family protein [Pseudonocardiaceae bacterium]|nr:phosphatase PAP2 family protein [Pseudonocardiaceae bacterium]